MALDREGVRVSGLRGQTKEKSREGGNREGVGLGVSG